MGECEIMPKWWIEQGEGLSSTMLTRLVGTSIEFMNEQGKLNVDHQC